MGSALLRVDVVRKGVHGVRVAVVPLQRDLYVHAVAGAVHVDRSAVDHRLVLVDELDERADASLVGELVLLAGALVDERDDHAGVQECQLPEAVRQRIEAVLDGLEDLIVGLERDLGAAPLRAARHLEPGSRVRPRSYCCR